MYINKKVTTNIRNDIQNVSKKEIFKNSDNYSFALRHAGRRVGTFSINHDVIGRWADALKLAIFA